MDNTLLKAILLCSQLIPKVIAISQRVEKEVNADDTIEAKIKDALNGLLDVVTDIVADLPGGGDKK